MPPALNQVLERFRATLLALDQMSYEMLRQVAQADLPDDKAALYASLLEKNQNEALSQAKQETLHTLRQEADLLMLRLCPHPLKMARAPHSFTPCQA